MVVQHLLQVVRIAADLGIGVLLVEQYARRALEVADRIYVMRRGRIAMSGRPTKFAISWQKWRGCISPQTRCDAPDEPKREQLNQRAHHPSPVRRL